MKKLLVALVALAIVGCAGTLEYRPPIGSPTIDTIKIVPRSRDDVWATLVPALGKEFFVINNLDKASGLINVSYSGDPERYVNCGVITSFVKNARGERTYSFPASRAQTQYEVMSPQAGLVFVDRRMTLDGRINVVLEEAGRSVTKVTVSTRYALRLDGTLRPAGGGAPQTATRSATFNGGAVGSFPASSDGRVTNCIALGTLEQEILRLIN